MSRRIGAVAVLGLIGAVGCGGSAARASVHPLATGGASEACWLAPAPATTSDSLRIAIDDRIAQGPGAAQLDDGHRLLESLNLPQPARLDCSGAPLPARTISWVPDSASSLEQYRPSRGARRPLITFIRLDAGTDPRDAIDRRADLLITADPSAVDYARARGDRHIVPLPPRWTYGVLSPGGGGPGAGQRSPELAALRESLGSEVVPAAARPASSFTAVAAGPCTVQIRTPAARAPSSAPWIVHRHDDPVARAIAERLVSLVMGAGGPPLTVPREEGRPLVAAGVDAAGFGRSLLDGGATAYVIAWPADVRDACALAAYAESLAPELAAAIATDGATLVPLIDVAQWAIVRRGALGLIRDAQGAVRIVLGPDVGAGGRR